MKMLLRCLVVLTVLSAGGGASAQKIAVSNTSVVMASSTETPTGGELSAVGLLQVQARVLPSGGVGVKMNVTRSAIFASVPGLFPDIDAIQARIAEIKRELSALIPQLAAAQEEFEEVRRTDIDERKPDPVTQFMEYRPLGAHAEGEASCLDALLCESVLNFGLVSTNGDLLPFQIRLTLEFTANGALAAADAVPCEIVCGGDSGSCSCS